MRLVRGQPTLTGGCDYVVSEENGAEIKLKDDQIAALKEQVKELRDDLWEVESTLKEAEENCAKFESQSEKDQEMLERAIPIMRMMFEGRNFENYMSDLQNFLLDWREMEIERKPLI